MRVSVLGLALVAAWSLVLVAARRRSSYWLLLTGLVPLGAGMGLAMTPATAAITDALPLDKQGVGSAMNDLARELGGALGIAVLGSVLQSTYRSHLDPTGFPEPVAEQARSSLAIASRLGPVVASQAQHAFVDGMQLALGCAAAVVAVTAIAVLALLQRPDDGPHNTDIDPLGADATAEAVGAHRLDHTRSGGIAVADAVGHSFAIGRPWERPLHLRFACHRPPGLSRLGLRGQCRTEERDVMRVFVAGGTGVIGRRLVPQLVARGHQVTATTTSAGKLGLLEQLGAEGVVMDGLDAASVGEAVAAARPDAIVHQMTALSEAHAGKPNLRQPDRFFATTNRLRSEGIDHLLAAAEATGVSHVVAQGHASMNGIRAGRLGQDRGGPAGGACDGDEGDQPPRGRGRQGRRRGPALRRVLRAGRQRRPGRARAEAACSRSSASGTGYFSWVHVDDAASATVLAVEQKAKGVFNIVDDEPAPVSEWLPYLAECAGAKPPRAGPGVAGPAAGRRDGGDDDDRGARLLQRQGQAGARLGAALPVVAAGLQGRARHDPGARSSRSCGRCCSRSPTGSSAA